MRLLIGQQVTRSGHFRYGKQAVAQDRRTGASEVVPGIFWSLDQWWHLILEV